MVWKKGENPFSGIETPENLSSRISFHGGSRQESRIPGVWVLLLQAEFYYERAAENSQRRGW